MKLVTCTRAGGVAVACLLAASGLAAAGSEWDLYSDTWVATDALGRVLPTHAEVGPPRAGKTVGIFYFLWLGEHGRDLYDLTKILAEDSVDPKYGPAGAFHFWGEPLFGYYLSDDAAVVRKHGQMLADAGVDVLILDVTNGFTYDTGFERLCEVFLAMRSEGMRTPQVAFLAHSAEGRVVQHLYDRVYRPGRFEPLWFRWQEKPLVLAAPQALAPELLEFFTVRESWAWSANQPWFGDGRDKWPWIDHHPQTPGWHTEVGQPEQVPVCVAQHPVSNIGRSFRDGRQPLPGAVASERGWCFAEQWRRALAVDPAFVFITGWNEWVAQRFVSERGGQPFLGAPVAPGGTFFVDQYNQEFSRDIEPMRGGHGDNYLYQMVANIRRYKGARALPAAHAAKIDIDGQFADWVTVQPEFRDTIGDPVKRNHPGWQGAGAYVNASGHNDLLAAKVAFDATHVFFYVRTRGPITPASGDRWMQLFIDTDSRVDTGWLGYDRMVNRQAPTAEQATLERHHPAGSRWHDPSAVPWAMEGCELELALPRAALGVEALPATFDFKWADGLLGTGDWTDFTLNGDVAPNDRFNYRARLEPGGPRSTAE